MVGRYCRSLRLLLPALAWLFGGLGCSANAPQPASPPTAAASAATASSTPAPPPSPPPVAPTSPTRPDAPFPIMLGIDVLEAQGFELLRGKRTGLLTHQAGVNREGVSSIDVLRRSAHVQLIALFAPEHGLSSRAKAGDNIGDSRDSHTGLPIYSLHGQNRRPTPAQLRAIDVLVVDLQDIGSRSYTYITTLRYALEACFEQNVEVVVLDRPNPLGGLKVDGPTLDREWMSGVGAYRIPYVHGLTIGEIARMAASAPGVLEIAEAARMRGRLTVVPMRGWRRTMRWPETGLTFVATSPYVQDFAACVGYAMVGLGCEHSGFKHGIGRHHPFRGISFRGKTPAQLERELSALNLPGLNFREVSALNERNQPVNGLYVEVSDWEAWRPTELSFHLMRLACKFDPPNPFAKLDAVKSRQFNIHVGSTEWWQALTRDGFFVDVAGFVDEWQRRAQAFQQMTRRYWLYP